MNSNTAYQCSDCGKIMSQDMTHRCVSTAGANPAERRIESIKCYICHRSRVDLFWIDKLSEFMCWPCIAAAVVVLTRETAPSNNGFHLTAAPVGSWATVVREAQPQVNPDR